MENINPIFIELKDISPLVAAIGHQLPYAIPAGYFDGLAVQVLLRIAVEEKAGKDPVLNIKKLPVYQAPEGYFDTFAGSVLQRIKALEAGDTTEELASLSPLLGQLGRKNPFITPEGYFNDFSDNMVSGIKAIDFVNEELENLSPLMASLKNKQVYEVPDGYFDATAAAVLEKAKQHRPAKLVSIGAGKQFMRYAAAAVVAGIITMAGYVFLHKADQVMVASTAKPALDSALAKVTDQDLESFLNNSTASVADTSIILTNSDAAIVDDTKDLLANISDEELQQYMDQRPETPISN